MSTLHWINKIWYNFFKYQIFFWSKIFFGYKISGRENIPRKGGFIIASNHLSNLDPMLVGAACPGLVNYMAKKELFKNPAFGWLISSVGAFPVKRNSIDLFALKEAIRRLKSGKALLLFPEGGRQEEGAKNTPYAGIGFLAVKSGAAVIPAFINGTQEAWPKHSRFIRPAKVTVRFGKQIPLERRLPYQDIALSIMENIRRLSDVSN